MQPTPHAGLGFPGTLQGDNERQQHQEETASEAPVLLGCRCCPSQSALMGWCSLRGLGSHRHRSSPGSAGFSTRPPRFHHKVVSEHLHLNSLSQANTLLVVNCHTKHTLAFPGNTSDINPLIPSVSSVLIVLRIQYWKGWDIAWQPQPCCCSTSSPFAVWADLGGAYSQQEIPCDASRQPPVTTAKSWR